LGESGKGVKGKGNANSPFTPFLRQAGYVFRDLRVIGKHLHVMAWEDQFECSFGAQFVIRGEPGRHIEDKAAGIVVVEAAGDVGAVRGDDRLTLGRVHEDRLQPRGVARGEKEFDPGQDDLIPPDQLEAVGSLHICDNAVGQRVRDAPRRSGSDEWSELNLLEIFRLISNPRDFE
jgi:hypothetical protein